MTDPFAVSDCSALSVVAVTAAAAIDGIVSHGRTPVTPSIDRRRASLLLSVLMPMYDEERTFERVIETVRAVPVPTEIVAVDHASTDGTGAILDRRYAGEGMEINWQNGGAAFWHVVQFGLTA